MTEALYGFTSESSNQSTTMDPRRFPLKRCFFIQLMHLDLDCKRFLEVYGSQEI